MFDVRTTGPRVFISILALIITLSLSLAGQESKQEKEKEKSGVAPGQVEISGTIRCEKPDPSYSLDVPDRSGHALILAKRKCTWTKPLVILGGKTKDGVWVTFEERMEGAIHPHTFEVDTLDDGEKITMQTMGQAFPETGSNHTQGRFSFMRGTGKYKGIKGGGTYEGTIGADDVVTFKLEGVYEPAFMAGGKK